MTEHNRAYAERRRVQAMKLVSRVINAPAQEGWRNISDVTRRTDLFHPRPSEWSFIDMDPLFAGEEWFALFDEKYDAQWPIDLAVAFPVGDSHEDFRIGHCRSISPKELRGYPIRASTKMVVAGNLDFVNGRYDWGGGAFSYLGKRWVDSILSTRTVRLVRPDAPGENVDAAIAAYIGMALRHRYEWSVILNFPTCRARFSTDATGALKMFTDRNLDPFGSRRAPLMHWVSRHWRKRRTVPEDLIAVRKHLRGRSDFEWRGFPVTIIPAEFEVEQAVKASEAA